MAFLKSSDPLSSECDDTCPHAAAWERTARAVGNVRDKLGLPVDAGIRDTVVVLNLLGLPTTQSCGGHVNATGHGLPAPWVDFVLVPDVLAKAESLLASFYAAGGSGDEDALLRLEGDRLGNGGGFVALETARRRLADGLLGEAEIDGLRQALARRQAEMGRFTRHLRRLLEGAAPIQDQRVMS